MLTNWAHTGPTMIAAFVASLVESVEALTVVLAVGSVRGWRSALIGSGAAALTLGGMVLLVGSTLARISLWSVQLAVGVLSVLFGMRWLRKAVLRAAGLIAIHDEVTIYSQQRHALQQCERRQGRLDKEAFATAFNITMLEGIEVVFIVVALGAGGVGLLMPASVGALAALFIVAVLGTVMHRPLSRVPKNALKFAVGVLLCAFGTFWIGEGLGLEWYGQDWSILGLIAGFLLAALTATSMCRILRRARRG